VILLIAHGADVNAQSASCNTPLIYGRAAEHEEVRVSLDSGADVEDHNEIGYTPLINTASAGHIHIAKVLLEHKNGINTRSNIFEKNIIGVGLF